MHGNRTILLIQAFRLAALQPSLPFGFTYSHGYRIDSCTHDLFSYL